MPDLMEMLPVKDEQWEHTKSGKQYRIVGAALNTITDRVDVVYVPLDMCEYEHFTRQIIGHPKAFQSKNEDGTPRFRKIEL